MLEAERDAGGVTLSGRIENVRVVPLDPETLTPVRAEAGVWHTLELGPVRLDGAARQRGWITLAGPTVEAAGFAGPSPEEPRSDWTGTFYGPDATEVAGQWRLWTPPGGTGADGHVSEEQWRTAGVGGRRLRSEEGEAMSMKRTIRKLLSLLFCLAALAFAAPAVAQNPPQPSHCDTTNTMTGSGTFSMVQPPITSTSTTIKFD